VDGIMLRKDRDVGRRGGFREIVWVQFGMMRKWSEALRYQEMWHCCIHKELCWWCVRSQDNIQMV